MSNDIDAPILLYTTNYISHYQAEQYYTAAATSLLLYHHALTFEQERRYVWKQRNLKAIPSLLFLFIRYTPTVALLLDQGAEYLTPLEVYNPFSRINWLVLCTFDWSHVGTINVQVSAAVTAVLVSSLFLNLREAAYRTRMVYDSPSEITRSVGTWAVGTRPTLHQTQGASQNENEEITTDNRYIGGFQELAVSLPDWDEEDYDSDSEEMDSSSMTRIL
ncbi:hypothetical protein M422DRAFT_775643 [Sphaerobolus stellatus SS14]|nr:hypothetical protein M422DRAFT_775643 [Sphaerobolus stellatus SS14]